MSPVRSAPALRRPRGLLTVLLACTVLVGCGGDSPTEPDPTVDGVWEGEGVAEDLGNFTLRLTMTEGEDGRVSGTGALGVPGNPDAIPLDIVDGVHVHPDLSVTLGASGFEDLEFTGVVEETRITGNLNGSGFTGQEVVLTRQ